MMHCVSLDIFRHPFGTLPHFNNGPMKLSSCSLMLLSVENYVVRKPHNAIFLIAWFVLRREAGVEVGIFIRSFSGLLAPMLRLSILLVLLPLLCAVS